MNSSHSHWDIFLTVNFFPVACLSGRALHTLEQNLSSWPRRWLLYGSHWPHSQFIILHTIPYFPQWYLLFVSLVCERASFHFICFFFPLDSSLSSLEHVGVIVRSPHKRWPYWWTTQRPSSQAKLTALPFISGSIHDVLVLRAQGTSLPFTRFQKACWKYSIMLFSLASPVSDKLERKHTYRQYTKHSVQPSVILSVKHMRVYGVV